MAEQLTFDIYCLLSGFFQKKKKRYETMLGQLPEDSDQEQRWFHMALWSYYY